MPYLYRIEPDPRHSMIRIPFVQIYIVLGKPRYLDTYVQKSRQHIQVYSDDVQDTLRTEFLDRLVTLFHISCALQILRMDKLS